jgi:two-component system response regulator YesN
MRKTLRNILEEVSVNNSFFKDATFTMARGTSIDSPAGLPACLTQARQLLMSRLTKGTGQLLEGPAPSAHPLPRGEIQQAVFRMFESAMEVRSAGGVAKALDELEARVALHSELSGEDILWLCNEVCATYLLLASSKGLAIPNHEMVYDEFCDHLDLCSSTAQALGCVRGTISVTFEAALRAQSEEDAWPIRYAKEYMEKNFATPISLDEVAAVAGFNASYFSTLFKKETGQTFSECLMTLRMEKAKEYLRDSKETLAHVCELVGYTDMKHFAALFKKYTGIKPGEFRKLYS